MSIRTGNAWLAAGLLARKALTQEAIVLQTAIVSFLAFSAMLDNFLSTANMITLVRNVAVLGMLSLGMAIGRFRRS